VTGVPNLVEPTPDFETLNTGVKHACGLGTDRRVYCWGTNAAGHLGDGTTTDRMLPVPVVGVDSFLQVSSDGLAHVCGVTTANDAVCWGLNSSGQLGNPTSGFSSTPLAVSGGLKFSSVADGAAYSCGITTAGELYCWGAGRLGQLGTGELSDSAMPTPVDLSGV
jgi:alpha-tubulin suppressor-like RCC1 family protein